MTSRARAALDFLLPRIFSRNAVVVVGIAVVASLLIPWHTAGPRVYPGLDPNLLFVNDKGSRPESGNVRINGDSAVITARENSAPTVHLVDSESDFSADFDVTPSKTAQQWQAASVTAHAPPGTRYFALLIGARGGTILFHSINAKAVATAQPTPQQPSFSDDFANPKLPDWFSGSGVERVSAGTNAGYGLQVTATGGQEAGTYTRVLGPIQQLPAAYVVSCQFRTLAGLPNFKIAFDWLDAQGRHISYGADWQQWAPFAQPFLPAMIRLWHPRKGNAINLEFNGALQPMISVVTSDANRQSTTKDLAEYVAGKTYHVSLVWKHAQSATFQVTTPEGKTLGYSTNRNSGFGLFDDPFVNLSVGSSAPLGATSSLEIQHVRLTIPAQTRFGKNVSDWRLTALTWAIVLWLLAYISAYFVTHIWSSWSALGRWRPVVLSWVSRRNLAVLAAIGALCCLYAVSAIIDGHPYDRLGQESAAYVIDQYGVGALYGRTSAVPDGLIRGATVPWSPAEFVYPPGMANFFIAVAKTWQLVHGSIAPMTDRNYYVFWKFAFALFILVCAGLILAISRRTNGGSSRWVWLLAGLFALSPAVIFDVAVWGQSNGLLLAILLLAVFALVTERPNLMWSAIVVAVLVKQTALLVVPLVALFALRRYGLRRSLMSAAFGAVVGFVFIAPSILAGYSPATALLPTIGKVADFGTPLVTYDTTVSADTFPIWVVPTGLRDLHGMDRLWTSDRATIAGLGISYATAGVILFLAVFLVAAWFTWKASRSQTRSYQHLFLAIALVVVAYVSLNTRTSGHYLILAVPFLLLGLPRAAPLRAFWKLAAVSTIALLSEYGIFMFIAAKGEWPNFYVLGSPTTNAFSGLVYRIYTSDIFITLFAGLMLFVVYRLLVEVATQPGRKLTMLAHASPEPVSREAPREAAG
jgi:hypothetical protein